MRLVFKILLAVFVIIGAIYLAIHLFSFFSVLLLSYYVITAVD